MKRLDRESLFLYSLHTLLQGAGMFRYDREQLGSALHLSQATFNLYLSRLKSEGLVTSRKRLYSTEIEGNISITGPGMKRIRRIERSLKGKSLTERDHNIPGPIELTDLLVRWKEPLDRVFLLNLYNHNPSFDLTTYLMANDMSKDDTKPIYLVHFMNDPNHRRIRWRVRHQLFHASLYGNITRNMLSSVFSEGGSDDALLLLSEVKIRMGRLDEAKYILEHLTSVNDRLSPEQRAVRELYRAELLCKRRKRPAALKDLKNALKGERNALHKVLLGLKLRNIMAESPHRRPSNELFDEELKGAMSIGHPLLLSVVYEQRGEAFLEHGKLEMAEENLLKAKRGAMRAGSGMAEAKALIGLSKLTLRRGMHDLSMSYLKKARAIYERCFVLGPVSRTEFLMALVELERGRSEKALRHYKTSMTVSFPLPCPASLSEREKDIKKALKRTGDPSMLELIYAL